MSITSFLLGRKLANREAEGRRIGALEGIPAMGLDGLGSASYGPEAMLSVLGAAGLAAVQPITWVILLLLAMLFLSYWQTIAAYPNNGGSYTVARENLGERAGLLAAAALMVDYMLNVAVGISAGVGALTSAVPSLHAYTLALCLGVLGALTLVNLRGTKESGVALAVPTYLFIVSLASMLALGIWRVVEGGAHPHAVAAAPDAGPPGLWLLLRAFAAGCTAMTGVEAVSNGVGAFREPTVRYAHRTLFAIVAVLGLLLAGIATLCQAYDVTAMDETQPGYQSVISQLTAAVLGRGWAYYITISAVLAVLCLSANTSFVGFPRLCRGVAADGYLPRAFVLPGRRLVYTAGILFLAAGAGGLLVAFGGITDRLIPLFAVGAFLSFTMSQAGMAVHWWRRGGRLRLAINGSGALATAVALAIILVAKFAEGAWLTLLVIPLTLSLLLLIRRYYAGLDAQVLAGADRCLSLADHAPPSVIVPIERWDRMAQRALLLATRLSQDVVALHLTELEGPEAEEREAHLRQEWRTLVAAPAEQAGMTVPELVIESSPYRSTLAPLLREMDVLRQRCDRRPVVVILSQLTGGSWWEMLLHTRRTQTLRRQVLRHGGRDVSILLVPWQLDPPHTAEAMAEEEPSQPP